MVFEVSENLVILDVFLNLKGKEIKVKKNT